MGGCLSSKPKAVDNGSASDSTNCFMLYTIKRGGENSKLEIRIAAPPVTFFTILFPLLYNSFFYISPTNITFNCIKHSFKIIFLKYCSIHFRVKILKRFILFKIKIPKIVNVSKIIFLEMK